MPSALETLVKVLKLERDQGYKNKAMAGGLAAYVPNWSEQALQQARRPEAVALAEEIAGCMTDYDRSEDREARSKAIEYMLGRITGRVAPPPAVQARIAELHARGASPAPNSPQPTRDATPEANERPPESAPVLPARTPETPRPPKPPKKTQPQQQPQRNPMPPNDSAEDGKGPEYSSLGPEFGGPNSGHTRCARAGSFGAAAAGASAGA